MSGGVWYQIVRIVSGRVLCLHHLRTNTCTAVSVFRLSQGEKLRMYVATFQKASRVFAHPLFGPAQETGTVGLADVYLS